MDTATHPNSSLETSLNVELLESSRKGAARRAPGFLHAAYAKLFQLYSRAEQTVRGHDHLGQKMGDQLLQRALPVARLRSTIGRPAVVGQAVEPPMPPAGMPGARAAQLRTKVNRPRNLWLGAYRVNFVENAAVSHAALRSVHSRSHHQGLACSTHFSARR
jgi:hypothetical protein